MAKSAKDSIQQELTAKEFIKRLELLASRRENGIAHNARKRGIAARRLSAGNRPSQITTSARCAPVTHSAMP